VTLPEEWVVLLDELVSGAGNLEGVFFRSVELKWGHPDDVISGEGTKAKGGRFVAEGMRAVYASLDEETATREATVRKVRLGGASQIQLKDYPRMTYVIGIELSMCVDLRLLIESPKGNEIIDACSQSDLAPSQGVGKYIFDKNVQGIVFPSVVCDGANVVVSKDVKPSPKIEIANRNDIVKILKELGNKQ